MHPFFYILGLGFSCLVLGGCSPSGETESKAEPPRPYPLIHASSGELNLQLSLPAVLRGSERVELRPRIEGVITAIHFKEGDSVKKGQLLFELDAEPYEAALAEAQAAYATALAGVQEAEVALAQAQEDVGRYGRMAGRGAVSQKSLSDALHIQHRAEAALASARSRVLMAEAQQETARIRLSYTRLSSPVDGVAGMVPWRVGSLVSPNREPALVSVAGTGDWQAYFSLSEKDWERVRQQVGEGAFSVRWVGADDCPLPVDGHIDAVSGLVDERTGCVALRASFPTSGAPLRSGAAGRVLLKEKVDGFVVIPQSATFEQQGKLFVWRVVQGRAQATPIRVYPRHDGQNYAVLEGVEEGDTLIASGAGLVTQGTLIPLPVEP